MALVDIADKETVAPELDTDLLGVTRPGGITALFTLSEIFGLIAKASVTVGTGGDYASLAAAQSAGKKWISLLPGTYSGAQSITQNDTILTGYGATFTAQTVGNTFSITGNRVKIVGAKVAGTFDGDTDNVGDSTNGTAFHVTGENFTLDGVTVENVSGFGVYSTAAHTTVKNSTFTNVATDAADELATQYCIYFNGGSHCLAFENEISGWCQAVGYWYASYGEAHSNILTGNYGYYWSGSELGARSAIEVYGEDDAEVYGTAIHHNHIDGATGYCIELADKLRGVHAHHNHLENFGASVVGSSVGAFTVSGSAGDEGHDVTVESNYIVGRGATAVAGCTVMGGNITIRGNEFVDYQSTAACLQPIDACQNLSITDNVFRDCGRTIYMSEANTHCATIEGNKTYGFVDVGGNWRSLYIQEGRGHSVRGNQFYGIGDFAAIVVAGNAEGAMVEGNLSFAPAGAAAGRIQVDGATACKRTKLRNNYVEGETQTYSYYINGVGVTFDGNECIGGQIVFTANATGKGRDNYVLNYARSGAGSISDSSAGGMVLTATLP